MYTRKELGEMALRRILGGARKPEFNLDIREIMIAVDQERDRQVGAYYKRKILAGDRQIEGDVLSNYVIPKASMTEKRIEVGTTANSYYVIKLPFKVISLPYDMGIYEVADEENHLVTFNRKPSGFNSLYSSTVANSAISSLDSYFESSKNGSWSLDGNILNLWYPITSVPTEGIRIKALTSLQHQRDNEYTAYTSGTTTYPNTAVNQFPGGASTSTAEFQAWADSTGGTDNLEFEYKIPAEIVADVIDAVVARYTPQRPYDTVIDNTERV